MDEYAIGGKELSRKFRALETLPWLAQRLYHSHWSRGRAWIGFQLFKLPGLNLILFGLAGDRHRNLRNPQYVGCATRRPILSTILIQSLQDGTRRAHERLEAVASGGSRGTAPVAAGLGVSG